MLNTLSFPTRLLWRMLIGIGAFIVIQKLFIHYNFYTDYLDHYFYDHTTYSISQLQRWFPQSGPLSLLGYFISVGNHFTPYLFPFALLYKLAASPFWLFMGQSVLLILICYPLLRFAEERFGDKGVWVTGIVMMGYLPFRLLNFFDFKGDIIIACGLIWAAHFLRLRKTREACLCALACLLGKESGFVAVFSVSFFLLAVHREWRWSLGTFSAALFTGLFLLLWLIPNFSASPFDFLNYYGQFGDSFGEKLLTILTRPDKVLATVFQSHKIVYLLLLLLPLGFLPLFSPYILLTSGTLAQNLLSSNPAQVDIWSHYTGPLVGILFFSAIDAAYRHRAFLSSRPRLRRTAIIMASFFVGLNVLLFTFMELRVFAVGPHTVAGYRALSKIPDDRSVSASTHYISHLTHRPTSAIQVFPNYKGADLVLVEAMDPFFPVHDDHGAHIAKTWRTNKLRVVKHLLLGERHYSPVRRHTYYDALQTLKNDPEYQQIVHKPTHYYLFAKKEGG